MEGRKEVPITELPNELTANIDKANSEEIVDLLKNCDEQIFNGWQHFECIQSEEFLHKMDKVASMTEKHISGEKCGVILSGCGTSGRMAFLICRAFNKLANRQKLRQCYKYINSGGDQGLVQSVESFEDDWNLGKILLEKEAKAFDRVMFIGITCGLSAPFVGGQVEHCLEHPQRFTPYLLGFNPTHQARTVSIRGTRKVLLDIVTEINEMGHLLNPVVGPEAITGSSRMKGGSATKIILEPIFLKANQLALGKSSLGLHSRVLSAFQATLDLTYQNAKNIASLIDLAGASLKSGGHVTYLGWGELGIMGLIDAAECVPTFGSSPDDVRCFVNGGHQTLGTRLETLSDLGFDAFLEKRYPTLSEKDCVIFLIKSLSTGDKDLLHELTEFIKAKGASIAFVGITTSETEDDSFEEVLKMVDYPKYLHVSFSKTNLSKLCPDLTNDTIPQQFLVQRLSELSVKFVLNAVTTGSHILKGKVMNNYMVDVKISNNKLFGRAITIVTTLGGVSSEKAKHCLLKAIYRLDVISDSLLTSNVSEHVEVASPRDGVVPVALLLSTGTFTVKSALDALNACPVVNKCIEKFK